MKHFLPRIHTLSIVLILCVSTTLNLQTSVAAQNSAYMALPEGAKARLGKGSIRKLAYTPDGNQLLVASSIGIWTYNADTMETLDLFDSTRFSNGDVVFSLNRRLFATRRGDHEETAAHLWNRIQRQHITNLKGHTRYIDSLDFSPDGKTLASASSDGTILLWEYPLAQLTAGAPSFLTEDTNNNQVLNAVFQNYPNPFNPETWIPYQLSEPAEVTVRIYTASGTLIRTLAVGHRPAGIHTHQGDAVYWDGKNELGEPVASGVYFYTLSTESTRDSVTAGDFTATRKMLIQK